MANSLLGLVTLIAALCATASVANGATSHKVLLVNDIHLDVDSTQLYSEPGTEASLSTLKRVMQEAADKNPDAEAILLMGDLCKHGLAVEINAKETNWKEMQQTMRQAIQAIVEYFPDTPILPVIGNNDVIYHDQAPNAKIAPDYYTDTWQLMFEEVPGNAEIAANETVKATWMKGGYYAYDLADDIVVISLNGMYPFYENFEDPEVATEMIEWVGDVLDDNPDKHFITQTHVFFGNNFYKNLEILWNTTYTDTILKKMQPHQDRHILSLGAHIHHVQLMAPESSAVENLQMVQVISPAVSPIYMNNPGFGEFTFNSETHVENLVFRFFQTEDYQRLGVINFIEYDLQQYTGVDLNKAESVRHYINSLFYNFQAYAGYIARNMGLRDFLAQGSQFFWPYFSKVYSDQADQVAVVCSLQYFNVQLFPSFCMRATKAVALPSNNVNLF